jgi:DNA-binding response OmpR family regulator
MPKCVLVVDDDVSLVQMVRRALEGEGLEVTTAANGAEALLQVEARRPDAMILDVGMPVLGGFDTLRLLRQKPETEALPIIILTARGGPGDIAQGWSGGVDMYLTKPFSLEELLTATRRLLEGDSG